MSVAEVYVEALEAAFSLAAAERTYALRGRRPKVFDTRGLHQVSLEVGRVQACLDIDPSLRELDFDPMALRAEAERHAERMFEEAIRGGEMVWDRRPDPTP